MSIQLLNQNQGRIKFRFIDNCFWKLQIRLRRIQVKREKKELKKKVEIIKKSAVNNKVPLSKKDDSHCRFISQINQFILIFLLILVWL